MARTFRRSVDLTVRVTIAPGVTLAQAKVELKTRVNELTGFYSHLDDDAVRIRKVTKCPN